MIGNDKSLSRLNWNAQQENFLRIQREQIGVKSWTLISKELNKKFPNKNRSGKQCRERYMNYIRFSDGQNTNLKWTYEEDEILFQKFLKFGRRWVEICKEMPGRSQNCLKNRFYGALRKICRRITKAMKKNRIKLKKLHKQEIYLDIFEFVPSNQFLNFQKFQSFIELMELLKNSLIYVAIAPEEQIKNLKICSVINQISIFLELKKYFCPKKNRLQKSESLGHQSSGIKTQTNQKQGEQSEQSIHDENQQQELDSFGLPSLSLEQEMNLQEMKWFYQPRMTLAEQDLEKEVSQILNKEPPDTHFDFV